MNAFEYAMKMELDGKTYFEEQAAKMSDPTLKRIFDELASDEDHHYLIFKSLHDGEHPDYEAAFKTDILSTTKNIFQKLSESRIKIANYPADVKAAWVKARDIEDDAENFYREQAAKTTDQTQKRIWDRIAEEEHKHWVAMNHIVDFIDRPNRWLEDAEWSNLEPY